jgi:SAM-dependent methyltransferase
MHEKKVEKFYSTGSKKRKCDYVNLKQYDKGFLSFGYWNHGSERYLTATQRLLDYFIENCDIKKTDHILNVACGYGAETFSFFEKLQPHSIDGLDITKVHVDYANNKAKALSLSDKIRFHHGNACVLDFKNNSFSHVFSIEGSAHFNTREKFLHAASRVLEPNGELLVTDIILGDNYRKRNWFVYYLLKITASNWVVPKENWVNEDGYRNLLGDAGFELSFFKKIGNKVFRGYARNGFSSHTIKTRISQRGFLATLVLTIISAFLGYLYNKGYIEYIYYKARKKTK